MTALLAALLLFLPVAWGQDEPSPMSFDEYEFGDEEISSPAAEARRAKRAESIDMLTELAADQPESERADLLLRLAHLMHQQGRETRDEALIERAVKLYTELVQQHPNHPQMDHILFYLGFALASLGMDEAEQLLVRVPKLYPSSEYVPHAYLHLGERLFARGEYSAAAQAYDKADGEAFPFRDFAVYKRAWAAERAGDAEGAVAIMREAVDIARAGLRAAAVEALAFWTGESVRSLAPAPRLVARSFGDCRDGLAQLRTTLAEAPMSAAAFDAQLGICHCLRSTGGGGLRGELRTLELRFGKGSSWWKQQDKHTRKRVKQALKEVKGWQ